MTPIDVLFSRPIAPSLENLPEDPDAPVLPPIDVLFSSPITSFLENLPEDPDAPVLPPIDVLFSSPITSSLENLPEDSDAPVLPPTAKRIKPNPPDQRLQFPFIPIWLPYKKSEEIAPHDHTYTRLSVTDLQTQAAHDICLCINDLPSAGISRSAWKDILEKRPAQLPEYIRLAGQIYQCLSQGTTFIQSLPRFKDLPFIQDAEIPTMARAILSSLPFPAESERFSAKKHALPAAICISNDLSRHIFIDIKDRVSKAQRATPKNFVNKGAFCKVKLVYSLGWQQCAVRKVLHFENDVNHDPEKEVAALELFRNNRGIISLITAGKYKDKWTVFLPLYKTDLWRFLFLKDAQPLSLDKKLDIASCWLDGLAAIATQGIHGDIKPENLLIGPQVTGSDEAVIADFGAFRLYTQKKYGATTLPYASPEYLHRRWVSTKLDVWGLGLCLYLLFTMNVKNIPWIRFKKKQINRELKLLEPDWILHKPWPEETPEFIKTLISDMLLPNPIQRLYAQEAFERFSKWHTEMWPPSFNPQSDHDAFSHF